MFSNAEELLSYISDEDIEYVDVRFCDLPGVMQHLTVPASTVDQDFLDKKLKPEDYPKAYINYAVKLATLRDAKNVFDQTTGENDLGVEIEVQ